VVEKKADKPKETIVVNPFPKDPVVSPVTPVTAPVSVAPAPVTPPAPPAAPSVTKKTEA
jgi:hypothetical protein